MDIILPEEIIEKLSPLGVLAYIAVKMNAPSVTTTAHLAMSMRMQSAKMREGLEELSVVLPEWVSRSGKREWRCGEVISGNGVIESPSVKVERFLAFVDDIKSYWEFKNKVPFSMDGRDGNVIRRWLDKYEWSREEWRQALRNRAKSVVNHSAPLYLWVGRLEEFHGGPLNEYGKPLNGSGKNGAAIAIEESNRSSREAFLNRSR